MSAGAERVIVFWVPDWPVHAHRFEAAENARLSGEATDPGNAEASLSPLALIAKHRVVVCSAEARIEGVRPGIREREAQLRCPSLELHPFDPEVGSRRFAPVLAAVERLMPGVESLRPGLCAIRARGPARYYGGEAEAGAALMELACELGLPHARAGIATGRFTAEQAARATPGDPGLETGQEGVRIVAAECTTRFLAPLPVARATGDDLAAVLHGLGIRTLGAFAELPEHAVAQRFGPEGLAAHRRALGLPEGGAAVRPRTPPREIAEQQDFEPPLDGAEQLAFACSSLADRFMEGLAAEQLVCTELRVELTDDIGARHERLWAHPRRFTAPEIVNRVRWQAAALPLGEAGSERGGAGIVRVRIAPHRTDRAASHEPGLWTSGPSERVHHHLSRAQSLLGHEGVGTLQIVGGRLAAERQRFVPWGTRAERAPQGARAARDASGPWPGALGGTLALPSTVFPEPVPAQLCSRDGRPIAVDADDALAALPDALLVERHGPASRVVAWSHPWPVRERWWAGEPPRFRLQVLLESGDAWLLHFDGDAWFAEGRYG